MRPGTARWILVLLTGINFVNYMDRFVIAGMYTSLHRDFGIGAAEFGLLTTITFAVHAATTVPFGWLADHWNRKRIVFYAVAAWSVATLLCAVVRQFWLLAFLRAFVGLAEAAYGPVSVVILCEIFPESRKARVVGIFNVGMFLGSATGLTLGGSLTRHSAFLLVGAPGLLLGALALVMPVAATRVAQTHVAEMAGPVREKARLFVRQLRDILAIRTLRWLFPGGILVSFAAGAYVTFAQKFVTELKPDFEPAEVSLYLGLVALSAGPPGLIVGGWLGDSLEKRLPYGRVLAVALGFLLCTPFGVAVVYVDGKLPFLASFWGLLFFMVWYNGPISAVVDDCVDPAESASAQAAYNFIIHLLGTAPAGVVLGLIADAMPGSRFPMLVPMFASITAVGFFAVACRFVASDMARRRKRVADEIAAGDLPATIDAEKEDNGLAGSVPTSGE